MKVVWSAAALDDFDRSIAFIAAKNPDAAARVADRIDRAARALGKLPTGRQGRVAGTYEKLVTGLPFVLAYALAPTSGGDDALVILRVIHGARDWPPGRWPQT
jgi:toxin ParE1/3/4